MGLTILSRIRWSRKLAAGIVLVCASIELYAFMDRGRGEPRNHDIRRFTLGEIYEGYRVEQRFLVKARGLSSVTIHPRPVSPAPSGQVILRLRDVTDNNEWGVLARISVPTVSLTQSPSFTLHVLPQPSPDREYAVDVAVEGGSDGQGIGLLASRGGSIHGASFVEPALFINGRRQYGNLVFETTVDTATSNFGSIASQMGRGGIPAPRSVLALVLAIKYAALFLMIRAFAGPLDAAAPEARTPQSLPA